MSNNLPDGPEIPDFLQSLHILLDPASTLDLYAKIYGEIFTLRRNSSVPTVVISNPEHIKTVFNSPPESIDSSEDDEGMILLTGKSSIMFLSGEKHRRKRRILMPLVHKDIIAEHGELISNITRELTENIADNKPFYLRSLTKEISLEIVLSAIFGIAKNSRYQQLKILLNSLSKLFEYPGFEVVLKFPFLQQDFGIWSDYLRIRRGIDRILTQEIKERKQENNSLKKDILSLLIAATDETNNPLTEAEIYDELMTFILAGYETTSAALSWLLYWVHYFPEIRKKLLAELNYYNNIAPEITKLPYLNAVVSETLRIYPIAIGTFSRRVKKTLQIAGYNLKPGTRIHPSIYLAHRRKSVYPEPEKFKPERFLTRQYSPYEYLPFGGGDRRCLGAELARFEMKIVLATILKQVNLELVDSETLKPIRYGIAMIPPRNLKIKIIPNLTVTSTKLGL